MIVETLFIIACGAFILVLWGYVVAKGQVLPRTSANTTCGAPPAPDLPSSDMGTCPEHETALEQGPTLSAPTPNEISAPTHERLRELMGIALTVPTPEAILEFSAFASRLRGMGKAGARRLGPYNIMMVFTQRPGA